MTLTYLKELEKRAIELGVDPLSLYSEALINFIDKQEATEEEVKKVVEVLKSSPNKIEWLERTYVTKVMSLDFGETSKGKLKAILNQLGYKNIKVNGKATLCVPLP